MSQIVHWFRRTEDGVLTLVLALLVLLPVVEIVLRAMGVAGLVGAAGFAQHLTLVVSMVGGAIAARENRLLALATAQMLGEQVAARMVRGVFTGLVSGVLGIGASHYVSLEIGESQRLGYDVPSWLFQLFMPLGFVLIAWRSLYDASGGWGGRIAAIVTAVVVGAVLYLWGLEFPTLITLMLIALVIAAFLGVPIFAVLGGATLLLFWVEEVPIGAMAIDHYRLATSPALPAIPLFTLAGFLLAESEAPKRIVRLFETLFGRFKHGAVMVTVIVSTFFTCFTGASGVTILALGGLLMPLLLAANYPERRGLGLIAGGGGPGVLFPPSVPLILFAVIADLRINDMFIAGLLPGLIMLAIAIWWGTMGGHDAQRSSATFAWRDVWAAAWAAKWELAVPIAAVVTLLTGLATPVETAAVTAFAAFIVVTMIHRELHITRDIPRVFVECGLLIGGIFLVLGIALGFTNYIVDAEVPDMLVDWVTTYIESKWAFLVVLNVVLLIAGCVMDIYSAVIVLVPIALPLAAAYGIHPVHLGAIFLVNLELGYLTPPVGLNLFFAAARFRRSVIEVWRASFTLFLLMFIGLALVTYWPALSTWHLD
ncbi:MAG: TRAP transporter large permease subunit [Pseudomonadota bacterium]